MTIRKLKAKRPGVQSQLHCNLLGDFGWATQPLWSSLGRWRDCIRAEMTNSKAIKASRWLRCEGTCVPVNWGGRPGDLDPFKGSSGYLALADRCQVGMQVQCHQIFRFLKRSQNPGYLRDISLYKKYWFKI